MIRRNDLGKRFIFASIISALLIPVAVFGQTQVKMPKNKYKVQDDIKLGSDAASQVDRQFPILNDADATRYVEQIGRRLVAAIPAQFREPSFNYRFKVVNARDINAFALPGGPMYVNRGMIESAKNEGEMAGVMAHEISHVALRHATAQRTKMNNPWNQILGAGAIIGGGILGGQAGAQAGQIFAAGYFLKYSRDYETQADILGSQIMANAGYDPRDLANMFRTIEQQGGSRAPEWLSSHPNPGNRYEAINREAAALRINGTPIKITRDFERVQSRLKGMPRAPSMEEIERNAQNNPNGNQNPMAGGRYSNSVSNPSATTRLYSNGSLFRASIPNNWRDFTGGSEAVLAPEGAFGDQGITHGAMFGTFSGSGNLSQSTTEYISNVLQNNSYLSRRGTSMRTTMGGRNAYTSVLAGRSPVTGRTEVVTLYTVQLQSGELFYAATVVPEAEASRYSTTFRNMINSVRLSQ